MKVPKVLKSKTIDVTTGAGALMVLLEYVGLEIPQPVVIAAFVIGAWILRAITKKPLSEK